MTQLKSIICSLAFLTLCLFITTGLALAQPPGGAAGDQEAGGQMQRGQGRTQMDQAERQQQMIQRYQELLGMSDEEWAVIGPYVLKVSSLSSSSSTRGSAMRTLMGNRRNTSQEEDGQDTAQNQDRAQRTRETSQQDENLEALETLLEDENATTDEIKAKLSNLRKARQADKQELAVAQKELRELLTLRQEAMLVVMGLLE